MATALFQRDKLLVFLTVLLASAALGVLTSCFPFVAAILSLVLLGLLGCLWISKSPYWVLLFLTAFMPFENFVLKFLPGSDHIYLASQFISELLIYLSFVGLIIRRALGTASFRRTPVDMPLLGFIAAALLSTVFNQAPLLGSLMNLRSLLRYVALFYLIVNLDLAEKQVNWLLRIILFVGVLQVLLGGVQQASAGAFNEYLMPRQTDLEVAGESRQFRLITRGRELGSVFGTLGDTVYFGLFMLVVLAVYLGRLKRLNIRYILFPGAIFVAIMYSYSRAAVFGMLLMLLVFYWLRYGVKRAFPLFLLVLPLVMIGILFLSSTFNEVDFVNPVKEERSIVDNLTGILSREYFTIAQKQRLGALIGTLPTTLANRPVLGYGFDEPTTIERLNESEPSFLLRPLDKTGFEDVYWVALLAYCGLVGVGFLAFFFYRLYSSARKIIRRTSASLTRDLALAVIYIAVLVPFLLFFNQVLEFRIFSFYFWMLSALMFGLYIREKREKAL